MPFVHCYGCGAVFDLDATACPECKRCDFCGQKRDPAAVRCDCDTATDARRFEEHLLTREVIPEELVEREKLRHAIAGKLRIQKIVMEVFAGMLAPTLVLANVAAPAGFGVRFWQIMVFTLVGSIFALVIESIFRWIVNRRLEAQMPERDVWPSAAGRP